MSSSAHAARLVELIEAARQEAGRLGAGADEVVRQLGEAAAAARAIEGPDGRPEEGVRPEDLTTGNDK